MKEKIKELKDFLNAVEIWAYLNDKEYEKYFEEYNKAIKDFCEKINKREIERISENLKELKKFFPHENLKIFHPKGHIGKYLDNLNRFLENLKNRKSRKKIQDALEELKNIENIKQTFGYFVEELEGLFFSLEQKREKIDKNNVIKLDKDLIEKIRNLKEELEEFQIFISHLVTMMDNEELKRELIKEIEEKNPGIKEEQVESYVLNLEKQLSFVIKKSEKEENNIEKLLEELRKIIEIEEKEIELNKIDEVQTLISDVHKHFEEKLNEINSFANDLTNLIEFYKNSVVAFIFEEMERINKLLDKKYQLKKVEFKDNEIKTKVEEKNIRDMIEEIGKQIGELLENQPIQRF